MTNQVRELASDPLAEWVGLVLIEATGDYWRQFYSLLEDAGPNVELVNAREARNLPGRKTDVSDVGLAGPARRARSAAQLSGPTG